MMPKGIYGRQEGNQSLERTCTRTFLCCVFNSICDKDLKQYSKANPYDSHLAGTWQMISVYWNKDWPVGTGNPICRNSAKIRTILPAIPSMVEFCEISFWMPARYMATSQAITSWVKQLVTTSPTSSPSVGFNFSLPWEHHSYRL